MLIIYNIALFLQINVLYIDRYIRLTLLSVVFSFDRRGTVSSDLDRYLSFLYRALVSEKRLSMNDSATTATYTADITSPE